MMLMMEELSRIFAEEIIPALDEQQARNRH
ncbi:hypothetical protein NTGHW29_50001 [Candidatus Nitrotoga sp. HW29]|nr:hypothetical protein NTGHW29_50001 [Candidatus Nitrotoga sp. HW29]